MCDIVKERAAAAAARSGATAYYDHAEMFARAELDAVLIATPHYASYADFRARLRARAACLMRKTAGRARERRTAEHRRVRAGAREKSAVWCSASCSRNAPSPPIANSRIFCGGARSGQLTRVTWINTGWFRSQAYYDSGGWRATWGGEGGGILTNQCPHNLDMYQWLFGLPARITGHASLGKYHNIEVEDEVTAYFEHDNGMIGHFIVTTGECPGTNRLEIAGENGKVVLEHGKITFARNRESMLKFLRETETKFDIVENWQTEIPVPAGAGIRAHHVVTEQFLNAILNRQPMDLVAHGSEGLRGVTLANGIMLSAFQGKTVSVPIDGDAFVAKLNELIATSTFVKQTTEKADQVTDFSGVGVAVKSTKVPNTVGFRQDEQDGQDKIADLR